MYNNYTYWFEDEAFIIVEAKNLKFKQARGISTFLANITGLPWSLDSASANSSNWDSMRSAIFLIMLERNSGVVTDQLQENNNTNYYKSTVILSRSSTLHCVTTENNHTNPNLESIALNYEFLSSAVVKP